MKIVVLDGYTLNPGDLSWEELEELGSCSVYERTPSELTVERAKDAEIVLTNKTVLSAEVIEQLEQVRYIGVLATGYNVVDVEAARKRGVVVTNVPAYGTESVAQMVFAHLLNLTQHVGEHSESVREGRWSACPDFCYWERPLIELEGLTMGIVGLGRIGKAVARLAGAFGMKVIGYDVVQPAGLPEGCRMVGLEDVFRLGDVVSLHCPLTPETERLVNKERLSLMKHTAFLINTSRGPLVDETALAEALNNGEIAGAGLDVARTEPPSGDNPLLKAKNCYITPHIAWATRSARERLYRAAVENVAAFIDGRPRNVVNEVM
ncbi:MAG: D-2-hydroxyacid dehydrogenase [Planctomycetota bacterium]|nr:MAG: D-2-hydroxyacid dehydrogenase [Planctomycetota bacterium]